MNIEQEVENAVAALRLRDCFTFEELGEAVRQLRGREIKVSEIPEIGEADGLCALLLRCQDRDLIFHAHSDSALHCQQFVLHEFAHIILDHCDSTHCILSGPASSPLLADIPFAVVERALARKDVDSEAEMVAESLADRLAAGIRGATVMETNYTEIFG